MIVTNGSLRTKCFWPPASFDAMVCSEAEQQNHGHQYDHDDCCDYLGNVVRSGES